MPYHEEDGTLVGLKTVKPATCPSNMRCEDSLCNMTKMSVKDQALLDRILHNYYPDSVPENRGTNTL